MIVIKGMDNIMPRHCTECWNCDKNFNNYMPKDKWICLLLMRFADQSGEKRLDDCPLELVADIESRPKGKWEELSREKWACEMFFLNKRCTNCGYEYAFPMRYNYCPECGSDNREEMESE